MNRMLQIAFIATSLLVLISGAATAQVQKENYPGSLCRSDSPHARVVGSRIENTSKRDDIVVSCPILTYDSFYYVSAWVKAADRNPVQDISCALKYEHRSGGYEYDPGWLWISGFSGPSVTATYPMGIQYIQLPKLWSSISHATFSIDCTIPRNNGYASGIDHYLVFEEYNWWNSTPGWWTE